MTTEAMVLMGAAATTGVVHTLIGPDHYLPFIMMSRGQGWSMAKTLTVTVLCGVGHVLSSVVLGMIGVAAGLALSKLEAFEGVRGHIAAWGLVAFGLVYMVWGLWRARTGRTHSHSHSHALGDPHAHEHDHAREHAHVHADSARPASLTPWVLFVIFAFGPCEVLIPQLMYPAARANWWLMTVVAVIFGVATIGTMTLLVAAATAGLRQVRLGFAERYVHAISGAVIAASGLAIQALGL